MIILWINTPASQVIHIVYFVSDHLQVNKILFGGSVIAIGNSLSDFFTNGALAKMGFGLMAVTGTVGGQLFNFLVGFGLNILIGCIRNGKVEFDIFGIYRKANAKGEVNGVMYSNVILAYAIVHLFSLAFIPLFTRYKLTRRVGWYLSGVYCVLISVIVIVAIFFSS